MGVGHIQHGVGEFLVLLQGLHPCAVHEIGAVAADEAAFQAGLLHPLHGVAEAAELHLTVFQITYFHIVLVALHVKHRFVGHHKLEVVALIGEVDFSFTASRSLSESRYSLDNIMKYRFIIR